MGELEEDIILKKVEKFKKRFSKSEKLPARISDTFDHEPTESEFEKILSGDGKIYFGIGSISIELDGSSFEVRYCDLDKETIETGKRPTVREIFEKQLGEIVNDKDLDDILIGKFERGDYKIFGTTENGHKSEQGLPILNIKRKINEIGDIENDSTGHTVDGIDKAKFEKELLSEDFLKNYLNMPKEELQSRFGSDFLKTVEFGNQNNNSHQYELFEHILRTVDSVDINALSEKDALKVKIAAFFHDIGKPNVAQLNEKTGQTQFIGHAKQSADIAKDILGNLGYTEQEIAELSFLIQSHDDFIPIAKKEDITEDRISKVLASTMKKTENYEPTISDFKKLIVLCKADAMAQNKVIERNGEIIDTQEDRISRLEAIEEILPKAIILKQEKEIEKLEKQKADLQNGPIPIEKNGKIVNQKQIDIWNAMTNEEKEQKAQGIYEQISTLKEEEEKLLETKEATKDKTGYLSDEVLKHKIHQEKAIKLEASKEESKKLSGILQELEKENQKTNGEK